MPKVTITIPPTQVGAVLANAMFVREGRADGSYEDTAETAILQLEDQLRSAQESEAEATVTADKLAVRHVLGACLVDVGSNVHGLCEAARPALDEILGAAERVEWLARTIERVEAA